MSLHPSIFFLRLPVYTAGWLAARLLTKLNEKDATAQSEAKSSVNGVVKYFLLFS